MWLLVALGAAGLGLTHYRVLALYALLALVALPLALRSGKRPALWLLGAGALALLLVAPWALHMARVLGGAVRDVYGGLAMPEGVEDPLPKSLLGYGWTPALLVAAGIGLLWACIRRQRALIAIGLWSGLAVILANPQWVGLQPGWFIGNTPVAISYWLPASALAGWLGAELARLAGAGLRRMRAGPWAEQATHTALGLALVMLTGWGGWRMVNIINPVTVLTLPADLRAMTWAREHLPVEARVLVNTTKWMNEVRMGSDGAWWLPLIAGREASLPCALYTQGPRAYRDALQSLAAAVEAHPALTNPGLLARLRAEGITHVMLGARGSGPMTPALLDGNPRCHELYRDGAARIYALDTGS